MELQSKTYGILAAAILISSLASAQYNTVAFASVKTTEARAVSATDTRTTVLSLPLNFSKVFPAVIRRSRIPAGLPSRRFQQ